MPPPQNTAEAHMLGLVIEAALEHSESEPITIGITPRFFTLEKSRNFDAIENATEITMLSEWTSDDRHLNYGDGPPPTIEGFAAAITAMLRPKSDVFKAAMDERVKQSGRGGPEGRAPHP